ncbi:MAG TPA: 2-dehydropantoate 2-reductase [Stellaceae bacterium]|jgi:2-dehydropantoate 2-reductase|nr:2-dehydropantoate 2-reductase [Stellaceae bacterium]
MKIAVFGAGAIGGYLAAKLAAAGHEVAVVARGPHLRAMQEQGLRLEERGAIQLLPIRAVERAEALGAQELVIIAVKAHAMPEVAPAIASLIGRETVLLPAQNGIPWWFPHRAGAPLEGTRIAAVDPEGGVARALDPARVVGCVVYMAAAVPEPGLVRRFGGNLLILGEPDGSASARLDRLEQLLTAAGIKTEVTARIRDAVWMKLWGNVAFNPVSVLTGAKMDRMADDPGVRAVLRAAMLECQQVAERLGAHFDRDVEQRIEEARVIGDFKTSMLQDFEAGRPVEIDALAGAVIELGRRVEVKTPMLDAIYALTRMRAGR